MSLDYEREEWYRFYEKALLELEQAKMAGRIGDAPSGIATCIDKLRNNAQCADILAHKCLG